MASLTYLPLYMGLIVLLIDSQCDPNIQPEKPQRKIWYTSKMTSGPLIISKNIQHALGGASMCQFK